MRAAGHEHGSSAPIVQHSDRRGEMALLLASIGGMRNHRDSKRKGQPVRDRAQAPRRLLGGTGRWGEQASGDRDQAATPPAARS